MNYSASGVCDFFCTSIFAHPFVISPVRAHITTVPATPFDICKKCPEKCKHSFDQTLNTPLPRFMLSLNAKSKKCNVLVSRPSLLHVRRSSFCLPRISIFPIPSGLLSNRRHPWINLGVHGKREKQGWLLQRDFFFFFFV